MCIKLRFLACATIGLQKARQQLFIYICQVADDIRVFPVWAIPVIGFTAEISSGNIEILLQSRHVFGIGLTLLVLIIYYGPITYSCFLGQLFLRNSALSTQLFQSLRKC